MRNNFQILHTEMEYFIKTANLLERQYIQAYVNKGAAFHLFYTVSTWMVCLALYTEGIVNSQQFPTDVSYPFKVDNTIIHSVLYAQQAIAIFIVASALIVDSQVAILIWFTCARFDIIGRKFEEIENEIDMKNCIKQHQHVLR